MEFKEFSNPEGQDYDIEVSLKESGGNQSDNEIFNPYFEELIDIIGGFIEDMSNEEIEEAYGISEQEYLNPTADVIIKVKEHLSKKGINR